ncbi:MAG: hypothetical protein NTW67_03225 [Candidatus Woesearchaeota archaeon]|nr:hypothetical protein [Candidatus Woesearchaeota archaeon]
MAVELYKHYFVSNGIIKEIVNARKTSQQCASGIAFWLLLAKHREAEREIFTDRNTLTEYKNSVKECDVQPGLLESLQGISCFSENGEFTPEDTLRLCSRIAAQKAPARLAFLLTADERKVLEPICKGKNYTVSFVTPEEIIQACGIEYPFKTKFVGQLSKPQNVSSK